MPPPCASGEVVQCVVILPNERMGNFPGGVGGEMLAVVFVASKLVI